MVNNTISKVHPCTFGNGIDKRRALHLTAATRLRFASSKLAPFGRQLVYPQNVIRNGG